MYYQCIPSDPGFSNPDVLRLSRVWLWRSSLLLLGKLVISDITDKLITLQSISVTFPLWVIIPEVLIIVMQVLARSINRCLLRLNKRIRARSMNSSLSNRYQLEANMRNIRLLQSFTLCDLFFVFTCFTLSAPIHYYSSSMDPPTYHALVEGKGDKSDKKAEQLSVIWLNKFWAKN